MLGLRTYDNLGSKNTYAAGDVVFVPMMMPVSFDGEDDDDNIDGTGEMTRGSAK